MNLATRETRAVAFVAESRWASCSEQRGQNGNRRTAMSTIKKILAWADALTAAPANGKRLISAKGPAGIS